ncbi:MAG: DUF58 domain-containing protein [Lentisphaerae bacterium]|nr:DUF58 domain-containing protein [Lentisphaerota bacterium]
MLHMIWPTPRGWAIGISGVIWLLVAMINHTLFALLFAWAALALTLVSFCCALFSLQGLHISRAPASDACVGQMLSLPLQIENSRRRRRQPLVIIENLPFTNEKSHYAVLPPMAGKSSRVFDRKVLAVKRGEFKLNHVILRGGDPAGLFYRERRFKLPAALVVYPPIEQLQDLLLHQNEALHTATGMPLSAAGNSQDFYGVREYTHSDGMRYIHWRSSARCGKFMVKEFERNAVMSVAVILDAQELAVSGGDWSNLEYLIRAAASICQYCSELHCSFAFAAGGSRPILVMPQLAAAVKAEVMYDLATLQPGKQQVQQLIDEWVRALPRNTVIFALSLSDKMPLRDTFESLQERGMDLRWYTARKRDFEPADGKKSKPARRGGRDSDDDAPVPVGSILTPTFLQPAMGIKQAFSSSN